MRLNFYPEWYIKRILEKYKKICRFLIFMLFVIAFALVMIMYLDFLKLKTLESRLAHNRNVSTNKVMNNDSSFENEVIKKYTDLINYINENELKLYSLEIGSDTMKISLVIEDKYEYTSCLEKISEKYKVVSVSPILDGSGQYYFTMQVKSDV